MVDEQRPPEETPPGQPSEDQDTKPPPDPLSTIEVNDLLQHPTLGPQLQSWADRAAHKSVQTALERERARSAEEARLMVAEAQFSHMSPEELGEKLSSDPSAAAAYAAMVARRQRQSGELLREELGPIGEIHAIAAVLETYSAVVSESDLPADVKRSLDPENYKDQGLDAYQRAVFQAFVKHESEKAFEAELSKRLDAAMQEKLAETDPTRPPAAPGAPKRPSRITREVLKRMSADEIRRLPKEDVDAALAAP